MFMSQNTTRGVFLWFLSRNNTISNVLIGVLNSFITNRFMYVLACILYSM